MICQENHPAIIVQSYSEGSRVTYRSSLHSALSSSLPLSPFLVNPPHSVITITRIYPSLPSENPPLFTTNQQIEIANQDMLKKLWVSGLVAYIQQIIW